MDRIGDAAPSPRIDLRVLDTLGSRLDALDGPIPQMQGFAPAAVLAALLVDKGVARLLLTVRAAGMRNHAGQISFPGGKPEANDRDLASTALREASEEVSLPPGAVRLLGRLPPVPTPSGFLIHPYVGRVDADFAPRINSPGEVAQILTPRLGELADPNAYLDQGERLWQGHNYRMHAFKVADPPLWGATARMVYQLLSRLGLEPDR